LPILAIKAGGAKVGVGRIISGHRLANNKVLEQRVHRPAVPFLPPAALDHTLDTALEWRRNRPSAHADQAASSLPIRSELLQKMQSSLAIGWYLDQTHLSANESFGHIDQLVSK
jgi:hypothetical protein